MSVIEPNRVDDRRGSTFVFEEVAAGRLTPEEAAIRLRDQDCAKLRPSWVPLWAWSWLCAALWSAR